jgi:hypothetical protein
MAKETYYFSHDYNARNDEKIKRMLSKFGMIGYGIYWALIEDLYNNTNVLRLDYECITFDLRCGENIVKSIINDFDLFVIHGQNFGSLSVERRLNERNEKSKKARESILSRWSKQKIDTNVLQSNYDSNTIKERKGKESKGKEIDFNFIKIEFSEIFNKWLDYKKSKNQKYKNEASIKLCYEKLIKFSDSKIEIAEQIINDAMANNYSGFFEPKQNIQQTKQSTGYNNTQSDFH